VAKFDDLRRKVIVSKIKIASRTSDRVKEERRGGRSRGEDYAENVKVEQSIAEATDRKVKN